jgi:lyso-ornithine lipid O-acyltransferase
MIGWLRLVYVALAFLAITAVLLPPHLFALWRDQPLARRIPRLWHRLMCPVLGLKVTTRGTQHSNGPLMLISNHVSWLDIIALGSVADVAFIAKSEVKDWPVFGRLARWQRSIFVERNQRRSTGEQVNAITARLERGEIVVLFAEGTTSDGNRVLEFKSSLLGVARQAGQDAHAGVVLQPVSIAYNRIQGLPMGRRHRFLAAWPGDVELLPHLLTVLREGAIDVEICFGKPCEVSDARDRKAVSRLLREDVETMLAEALRR